MSMLGKLWTALRGGARELGDAVVDANGIRIFEQELSDATEAVNTSKQALAEVMARKMQCDRKVKELEEQIAIDEGHAKKALAQGNEALALEVAQRIVSRQAERADQAAMTARLESQITQLRQRIEQAEKIVADHERELSMVRTTEQVQKATVQLVENISANDSTIGSARESLERIKRRQQYQEDRLSAAEILAAQAGDKALDLKLREAGIIGEQADAEDVLTRIRSGMKP